MLSICTSRSLPCITTTPTIRDRFGKSGVLDKITHLIRRLSVELDHIGLAIQLPVPSQKPRIFAPLLEKLKRGIDALGDQEGSTLVLKKVLVSLRTVGQRVATMQRNLGLPTWGRSSDRVTGIWPVRIASGNRPEVVSGQPNA